LSTENVDIPARPLRLACNEIEKYLPGRILVHKRCANRGIIILFFQEISMYGILQKWERRARHMMCAVAVVFAGVAFAFKAGWIATEPTYHASRWYTVTEHAGFVLTTEHASEFDCRTAAQTSSVACRPGRSLIPARSSSAS
jgi:hypothetical protein